MGACEFEQYVAKTDEIQTAEQAYKRACDEAGHDSGYGGYSGTIVEKSGFFMKQPNPVSMEAAGPLIVAEMDVNDKWGPAACLAIAKVPTRTHKVVKTVTVTVEDAVSADALKVLFDLNANEWLTDVEVVADDRKYKTKVRINRGKAERKFLVANQSYATLAEATAAVRARQEATAQQAAAAKTYKPRAIMGTPITEVVTRGGEPAATVTTELVSRRVKVTATRVTPTGGSIGPVEGWLFFGLASC